MNLRLDYSLNTPDSSRKLLDISFSLAFQGQSLKEVETISKHADDYVPIKIKSIITNYLLQYYRKKLMSCKSIVKLYKLDISIME